MRKTLPGLLALGLLSAATVQASTQFFNFNSDPTTSGLLTLYGNAQWFPDNGAGFATNANDGYLQVTAATGSQRSAIVFADFDHGAVVQGFSFDADFRIGNGTAAPADGFSINYVRSDDPVLSVVANGGDPTTATTDPNPPAGAQWIGHGVFATGPNAEDNLPEEGTWTGISVGFDAWNSGGAATGPWPFEVGGVNGCGPTTTGSDIVGIDVRVDGWLIQQVPMPTLNGSATDPTSIQTGPDDASGTSYNLGWAHLTVTVSTTGVLDVYWKGSHVVSGYQTTYFPSPGALVFAGRTGGSYQFQDVDNIAITTMVAQNVVAGGTATGLGDGVSVQFFDSGAGVVDITKPATVSIDGGAAVPVSGITKNGTTTTIYYYGYPTPFVAGSAHTVKATVTDGFGRQVSTAVLNFTPGASSVVTASTVTGVDTSTTGFLMRTWQSGAENSEPNSYWWANEQLNGLQGANLADTSSFTDNGYLDFTSTTASSSVGYVNMDYAPNTDGNFQNGNGYQENYWPGLSNGANGYNNIDNTSAEILAFLHFPGPGVYTMGVNSDDGFQVTVGASPADWFSQSLGSFLGGRGASDTQFTFVITNAGYYPFRLVWENGTGGANCEWFMVTNGTRYLINDPSPTNICGVQAYYHGPTGPAYVSDLLPYPAAVTPRSDLFSAQITDTSVTTVSTSAGTFGLAVDGKALTGVTATKASGVTTIAAPAGYLLPLGTHTGTLVYTTTGGTFTNSWTFQILGYLLSNWAVTGVDTTQPGFRIRPFQSAVWPNINTQPNTVQWTLEQLAGLHGPSTADYSTATDHGYIDYAGLINFNLDPGSGQQGDFNTGNGYTDLPFPGLVLPGAGNAPPGAVPIRDIGDESMDILAFVQFSQSGVYTMGVNSDDGFAVYAGANPSDWFTAELLGSYNGGRGSSDTTFEIFVPTAGIYPFRMIYENGNGSFSGGNAANCEWFILQPDGTKVLLNDPNPPNSEVTGVTAFWSGPTLPAYVSAFCPANGATGVYPIGYGTGLNPNSFGAQLTDGSTTVTPASIQVYINGVAMTPVVTQTATTPKVTTVTLPITSPLSAGTNVAGLVYTTTGGAGAGTFSNSWSFVVTIPNANALNPAWAVTGVNTSDVGFKYRPWNSGQNGGQPNTVWWTEEQLAGFHGPNNANLGILNDGNYYDLTGVINFDIAGPDGNFQSQADGYVNYPDMPFPGLPGANGVTDNSSFEILCYLQFANPGIYSMGVNSDDGFKVTAGPNPADWFALNLGQYNGGRGSSDTTFSFVVPAAGIYPFRLIYENGGGGMNCEWFMINADGAKILLNDPAAPESTGVKAYYSGPALPAGVTAVTPTPTATDGLGTVSARILNGGSTIGTVTLTIDGTVVSSTVSTAGGVTTVTYDGVAPAGAHVAVLTYTTTGTGAGTYSVTWSFTTTAAPDGGPTLPASLWTPVGSGTNAGFKIKVWQYDSTNAAYAIYNGWQNISRMADEALNGGFYGDNVADTSIQTNNGACWWTGPINFASNDPMPTTPANEGNFEASAWPDAFFPGLGYTYFPSSTYTPPYGTMNYVAMEAKTFLEFPSAGYYVMGVNSDDGFRVTVGDRGAPAVGCAYVIAPAASRGDLGGMYMTTDDEGGNNGFGSTPPSTVPMIGKAVLCNPVNANSLGALQNASALAGNIAVFTHNGNFQTQARMAAAAGAIAAVVGQTTSDGLAGTRAAAGNGTDPAMPCVSLSPTQYAQLTNNITQDTTSPVILRITAQDCSTILGKYDNGRGSSDTLFGFTVPAPGVYPFRLIYFNGTGGCNCELFIRDTALGDYLVGAPGAPVKAWTGRNVHAAGALPAPVLNKPISTPAGVVISWTGEGELWESYSPSGPWFKSTYQANPSTVVQSPYLSERFFRVRMY